MVEGATTGNVLLDPELAVVAMDSLTHCQAQALATTGHTVQQVERGHVGAVYRLALAR
jgi:hypothetical protein